VEQQLFCEECNVSYAVFDGLDCPSCNNRLKTRSVPLAGVRPGQRPQGKIEASGSRSNSIADKGKEPHSIYSIDRGRGKF